MSAAALLAACGGPDPTAGTSSSGTSSTTSSGDLTEVPDETGGYEQSVSNVARTSLASDNVFGDDGGIHQLASMGGDASAGYTAALTIGV